MGITDTLHWHQTALPVPSEDNKKVILGVHIEEFVEMLDQIELSSDHGGILEKAKLYTHELATILKTDKVISVTIKDRKEFLDAICDQLVTATGCAHMQKLDVVGGLDEVNRSNFSKFEDGKPVFNEHGKIAKGKNYTKPDLSKFI